MPDQNRWIIGHRGAPSLAPENTLGGFRKAAETGASWVELDVTLLADNTMVVNHDPTTDRCSNTQAVLAELIRDQLKGIDNSALYPDWPYEPLPLLSEVFRLLNELNLSLNLELKDHGLPAERVVSVLKLLLETEFNDNERLIISSFSRELLDECHRQIPEARLGLLCESLPEDWQEYARHTNIYSIHSRWSDLSYNDARQVKEKGYKLLCWTANQPELVESLWMWGMDAIITDNPQDYLK
ncbi:glycerophosphodiester phosphodiesterase family protein [Oceanospirillum sediminis]|uniref:Glycerophosphoryl diester phosphodiesterase n=1 Tax=Oceanospirillum sediminis TaxID=2760088 RepID=A0A839IP34_9GAMM|nr:glycerophosphodiester phosphodiesterase family protein [Oceanospirillum sediminis]MBB1486026.1 glycerophosphoryl diester phosphodiesterase [Oceanospirillum sediminis]